jgi:predicted small secreted protein
MWLYFRNNAMKIKPYFWRSMKTMIVKILALAVAATVLSGCKTTDIASRGSIVEKLAGRQAQADRDHEDCVSYGYTPGSNGYAQCRMQFAQMRSDRAARNSANMRAASFAIATQQSSPRMVTCNSNTFGNTTNTICH